MKEDEKNSFAVMDPPIGYEMTLQSLWDSLPDAAVLTLEQGTQVEILFHGVRNLEAGPDFRDAKIRFADGIRSGDVEIHCRASDFIRHGHLADPAYSHVILHVVAVNDMKFIPPKGLQNLPVAVLNETVFHEAAEKNQMLPSAEKCPFLNRLSPAEQQKFFRQAGLDRMHAKAQKILHDMIKSGTSGAFLEKLFSAAGYKNNSEPFRQLLHYFLQYPQEIRKTYFRAILWGESGLLPDPAAAGLPEDCAGYAKGLWEDFWKLRLAEHPALSWRRDGVRPGNSPERRLAMLCAFLEKFSEDPLPSFAEQLRKSGAEIFRKEILKSFQLNDPFWERRSTFREEASQRKSAVLASSRGLTLCVDVLAPALFALSVLKEDHELEKLSEEFYRILPAPDSNSVIRIAAECWYGINRTDQQKKEDRKGIFPDSAAVQQGWLHTYKEYCSKVKCDCSVCLLANSIRQ